MLSTISKTYSFTSATTMVVEELNTNFGDVVTGINALSGCVVQFGASTVTPSLSVATSVGNTIPSFASKDAMYCIEGKQQITYYTVRFAGDAGSAGVGTSQLQLVTPSPVSSWNVICGHGYIKTASGTAAPIFATKNASSVSCVNLSYQLTALPVVAGDLSDTDRELHAMLVYMTERGASGSTTAIMQSSDPMTEWFGGSGYTTALADVGDTIYIDTHDPVNGLQNTTFEITPTSTANDFITQIWAATNNVDGAITVTLGTDGYVTINAVAATTSIDWIHVSSNNSNASSSIQEILLYSTITAGTTAKSPLPLMRRY